VSERPSEGVRALLHVHPPELEDHQCHALRRCRPAAGRHRKLSDGGEEGRCGWLKDRFGLSWQIVPTVLPKLLDDPDAAKSQRVMQAMMGMKKIQIDELEQAAAAA